MAPRASSCVSAMCRAAGNSVAKSETIKPFSWHSKKSMRSILYPAAFVLCGMLATFQSYADSLWNDHTARSIVGDKRAVAVGDILNIVVQENNSASKDNQTKTSKQTAVDASISSFLYSPA